MHGYFLDSDFICRGGIYPFPDVAAWQRSEDRPPYERNTVAGAEHANGRLAIHAKLRAGHTRPLPGSLFRVRRDVLRHDISGNAAEFRAGGAFVVFGGAGAGDGAALGFFSGPEVLCRSCFPCRCGPCTRRPELVRRCRARSFSPGRRCRRVPQHQCDTGERTADLPHTSNPPPKPAEICRACFSVMPISSAKRHRHRLAAVVTLEKRRIRAVAVDASWVGVLLEISKGSSLRGV